MEFGTVQELGTLVRAARRSHKITQEQAAALCGVSMPFLNQLEGGKRQHLSLSKVLGVCAGLGLRLQVSGPGVPGDYDDLDAARVV